jgi:hypothetical protein
MDCRDMFYDPINPLPRKCAKCAFPDLNHVPQPYYLVKSRTMSPNEMAPAENGNFLVRLRVRRVLEYLAPDQCRFFPTSYKGTVSETPWFLAVPARQVVTATVKPSIPRCDACGEPRSAHPGTQYEQWLWDNDSDHDLLKSATWGSSESGWDKWISRDLFMSVRLFRLLKEIKAKGLDEATCGTPVQPTREEAEWIEEKLPILKADGIPFHAVGTLSEEDATWLRKYIKTHSRPDVPTLDTKAAEKRLKLKLPKSYVEFIAKVGPATFENVDEQEGFTVQILTPDQFDARSYRVGALDGADEDTNAVDGVVFAGTEHGDCLCFDLDKSKKEFAVYLYKHEYNRLEPYADNFAACIKRLAGGGDG